MSPLGLPQSSGITLLKENINLPLKPAYFSVKDIRDIGLEVEQRGPNPTSVCVLLIKDYLM